MAATLGLPAVVLLRSLHALVLHASSAPAAVRAPLSALIGLSLALALLAGRREWVGRRRGETRAHPLAPLARFLCLATAGWCWLVLGQPEQYQAWRVDLAGSVVLIVHALLLLGEGQLARLPRRLRRATLLIALELGAVIVLGEAGLRILSSIWPNQLIAHRTVQAAEVVASRRPPAGSIHFGSPLNSRGYNDEEFGPRLPEMRRVVVIGDSFSLGLVPWSHHYTTIAEQRLPGVEFANVGISYLGPHEYRWMLEHEGLDLEPDLVVVSLFIGNDIYDAVLERTRIGLTQRVFDRRECLTLGVARRLWRLRGHNLPKLEQPGQQSASAELKQAEDSEREFPWLADALLEPATFDEQVYLAIEVRLQRILAEADDEHFEQALQPLVDMRDRARPVPLAVLILPDEFQVEDAIWNEVVEAAGGGPFERDRPQRLVAAGLTRHGIPFRDTLPALRALPPLADGRRHAYHLRDTHFNARGNRVVGEELAALAAELLGRSAAPDAR